MRSTVLHLYVVTLSLEEALVICGGVGLEDLSKTVGHLAEARLLHVLTVAKQALTNIEQCQMGAERGYS